MNGESLSLDAAVASARKKVLPPALLLMVTSAFPILLGMVALSFTLLSIYLRWLATRNGSAPADPTAALLEVAPNLIVAALSMCWYAFVALAGWKLWRLESSYPVTFAAAVMACVPCSLCCVLTLPAGIWTLIVIHDSEVRNLLQG